MCLRSVSYHVGLPHRVLQPMVPLSLSQQAPLGASLPAIGRVRTGPFSPQHCLGYRTVHGLLFLIDPDLLIIRQETGSPYPFENSCLAPLLKAVVDRAGHPPNSEAALSTGNRYAEHIRMASIALRSGIRGRPPFGFNFLGGSSGSIRTHSSSGIRHPSSTTGLSAACNLLQPW